MVQVKGESRCMPSSSPDIRPFCTAANAARLRTKQGLLDVLVERARDQTSWTRAAVCRSWMALAVDHRVPMGHWLTVTQLAIGELHLRTRSAPSLEHVAGCGKF
jgi:hypothetical protein